MRTSKHMFPLLVTSLCTINNVLGETPNITLNGTRMKANSLNVIQLDCKTNIETNGCWMEFHKNDKTEDTIRFENQICHHKSGTCLNNICDCSKDCKTFKLNITSTSRIPNTTYGCETRIAFNNVIYRVRTAIKPVGEDFEVFETVISAVNTVVADPGVKPSHDLSTGAVVGIIVGAAVVCSCPVGILLWLRRRINRYNFDGRDNRRSHTSSM